MPNKYLITYTVYYPKLVGRHVTTDLEEGRPRTMIIGEEPMEWFNRCGWDDDRYTDTQCVINMIHEVKNAPDVQYCPLCGSIKYVGGTCSDPRCLSLNHFADED